MMQSSDSNDLFSDRDGLIRINNVIHKDAADTDAAPSAECRIVDGDRTYK